MPVRRLKNPPMSSFNSVAVGVGDLFCKLHGALSSFSVCGTPIYPALFTNKLNL